MNKFQALKKYFGYDSFREGQTELIDALTAGRDCLGVMPTGAGKSICYQIPALMLTGITLVVSPLISLMRDQVLSLVQAGVPAAFLNSSLTPSQYALAMQRARDGWYKIIYIAPERLLANDFLSFAKSADISLIAVDEAHCVSQWGQDFRPSYLDIASFIECLPKRPPIGAFTATATRNVKQDIVTLLKLHEPVSLTTGFNRENLYWSVVQPKEKDAYLIKELSARRNKSGIIYCSTRKNVEALTEKLCYAGFAATRYHAGLTDAERTKNQEDFVYDRKNIMVATNAFGMGIDKSNVAYVIHYNMPKDIESYYQEAGRAGRDGEPADCILMYSAGDVSTNKYLIMHSSDDSDVDDSTRRARIKKDLIRLDAMIAYCKTSQCLRKFILNYFDERHPGHCDNCENCNSRITEIDITDLARSAMECVESVNKQCGYGFGAGFYTRILCGSRDKRILELGLDALPVYGAARGIRRESVRRVIDHLIERGYFTSANDEYGVLTLTDKRVDMDGERLTMIVRERSSDEKESVAGSMAPERTVHEGLYNALKNLRTEIARREGVPAYIVFNNHTLAEMAAVRPGTIPELMDVSGVGMAKANKYGRKFLDVIAAFVDEA